MLHPLREVQPPPLQHTDDGRVRRIGVEVEFAAIGAEEGAHIVAGLFGGRVVADDPHRFFIEDTEFGRFVCELDTQYAHRPKGRPEPEPGALEDFRGEMRRLFGDLSSVVMPCEVVCPPIPLPDLPRLDALVDALKAAGAEGTRASPFYAFGAQLNLEIATADPVWLGRCVRAYLLLSPWLRDVMGLDFTRRAVSFADPFPREYVLAALSRQTPSDLDRLIADYLAANPTRNRELDMLPLFSHLQPDRVAAAIEDPRVQPRPAFHYRLPDANLGAPDWSLCLEWNRWCVVERLAATPERLDAMAADYTARLIRDGARDWPRRCAEWLVLSQAC